MTINVKKIRLKLKMSQTEFSDYFGIPLGTLRDWEYERRSPVGSSLVLLMAIDRDPDAIHEACRALRGAG